VRLSAIGDRANYGNRRLLGRYADKFFTEEALQWAEDINQEGLRDVIADRDRPWQDYGQQP
jgi:two-component SAPR family response regulator